jgi:hypothetical protein
VILEELISLSGGSARELRVITTDSAHDADPWRTVLCEDIWWRLYVGEATLDSPALEALLLLVADDKATGVILTDDRVEWLYHPYDGGGDVIAPNRAVRDLLREKYSAWLSRHPAGL